VWRFMTWRAIICQALDAAAKPAVAAAAQRQGLTLVHLSSQPVLVSEPFCVHFVTSYDPYIY